MDNIQSSNNFFQAKDNEKILPILKDMEKITPRKAIASHLGMNYKTYSRVVKGDLHIPFDKISALCELPGGERVLQGILDPLKQLNIKQVRVASNSVSSVRKHEVKLPIYVGDLLKTIEKALTDGVVDSAEAGRVHLLSTKCRQLAAELDLMISKKVRK